MEEKPTNIPYVSQKVAMLAKKAGFDLYCDVYYHHNNYYAVGKDNYAKCNSDFKYDNHKCTAPRQSVLHMWLREYRNIILIIDYTKINNDQNPFFYRIIDLPHTLEDDDYFITYNEALDAGLEFCLNLLINKK